MCRAKERYSKALNYWNEHIVPNIPNCPNGAPTEAQIRNAIKVAAGLKPDTIYEDVFNLKKDGKKL